MCRPCPSFTRLFARGAALGSPLHPVSSHLLLNLLSSTLANMLITHDSSNVHLYVEFPSCMSHGLLEFNISQIPLIFFPSKPVPTSIFCFSWWSDYSTCQQGRLLSWTLLSLLPSSSTTCQVLPFSSPKYCWQSLSLSTTTALNISCLDYWNDLLISFFPTFLFRFLSICPPQPPEKSVRDAYLTMLLLNLKSPNIFM